MKRCPQRRSPPTGGVVKLRLVLGRAGANGLIKGPIVAEFADRIAVGVDIVRGDFHHRSAHVSKRGADGGGNDRSPGQYTLGDYLVEAFNKVGGGGDDYGMGKAVHFGHLRTSQMAMAMNLVVESG